MAVGATAIKGCLSPDAHVPTRWIGYYHCQGLRHPSSIECTKAYAGGDPLLFMAHMRKLPIQQSFKRSSCLVEHLSNAVDLAGRNRACKATFWNRAIRQLSTTAKTYASKPEIPMPRGPLVVTSVCTAATSLAITSGTQAADES